MASIGQYKIERLRTIILILQIFSIIEFSFAQAFTISGKVKDAAIGEALPAASIRIVGTSRSTITNVNGDYRFSLTQGDYTLAFVFIGYKTDTLNINLIQDLEKEIKLTPLPIQLAEGRQAQR
jgi:iron complex outermembrane receptor protein